MPAFASDMAEVIKGSQGTLPHITVVSPRCVAKQDQTLPHLDNGAEARPSGAIMTTDSIGDDAAIDTAVDNIKSAGDKDLPAGANILLQDFREPEKLGKERPHKRWWLAAIHFACEARLTNAGRYGDPTRLRRRRSRWTTQRLFRLHMYRSLAF